FPVFSPSNAHLFFVLPLVLELLGVLGHKNRPFRFETACFHSFLDGFNFGTPAFGAHYLARIWRASHKKTQKKKTSATN
ncbi:MAG: hypothetical protein J6U19_06165, partial [Oscillospiraceae bacterium]|nr:hypothetical protein [Oscillospiraceae bacterium]